MVRVLTAALLVVATPLSAQTSAAPPPAVAELRAVDSPAQNDMTYLQNARESGSYEVASSRLALQRSRNRQIKAFGQMMINHHTRSVAELARLQGTRGASLADGGSEPKAQMLDKLRSSARAEFDMNYVQGQLAAHEEALALHRIYAATGQNAALRQFAQRASALVQDHLSRARTLPRSPR